MFEVTSRFSNRCVVSFLVLRGFDVNSRLQDGGFLCSTSNLVLALALPASFGNKVILIMMRHTVLDSPLSCSCGLLFPKKPCCSCECNYISIGVVETRSVVGIYVSQGVVGYLDLPGIPFNRPMLFSLPSRRPTGRAMISPPVGSWTTSPTWNGAPVVPARASSSC